MKRALLIPAIVIGAALATVMFSAAGCATATGEISGGEPRFQTTTCADLDAGPLLSTGHTWSELYADYFGNPNRSACAGNGACHGDATQLGAQSSNYVCPLNDQNDCYASITSATAQLVTAGDPTNSALTTEVLRHADGTVGNMPQTPCYGFSTIDIQRINDWIAAGATNDTPAGTETDSGSIVDASDDASD